MATLEEMAKKEYEALKAKRDAIALEFVEIDKKLKPLEEYLMAVGALQVPAVEKKKRRGRKPKDKVNKD